MSDDLNQWMQRVEDFGGRVYPSDLLAELARCNLGSQIAIPTSGAVPISANPIPLAEVSLSRPMAMDVTFAYLGMQLPELVPTAAALDPGQGFVRVSWGMKGGGPQMTADIDGANGWRHEFVASYVRVDYHPLDVLSQGTHVIPVGQQRDLNVAVAISPAAGGVKLPITRTIYYPSIAPGGVSYGVIPRWTRAAQLSLFDASSTVLAEIEWADNFATPLTRYEALGTAVGPNDDLYPKYPVPQRATFVAIRNNQLVGALTDPKLICELAL